MTSRLADTAVLAVTASVTAINWAEAINVYGGAVLVVVSIVFVCQGIIKRARDQKKKSDAPPPQG